jgi:hypothetical protein
MGDDKWLRRKPGSVSGTVVPPPVEDDPPPLPQRRTRARHRYRPDPSRDIGSHGSPETRTPPAADPKSPDAKLPDAKLPDAKLPDAKLPDPKLPDNVRLLFQPVLRARDASPGNVGSQEPNCGPARNAHRSRPPGALSHPVHGPALRDLARPDGHGATANGAGSGARRHLAWLAALTVLVLLTAAGTTVALLGQRAAHEQAGRGGRSNAVAAGGSGKALSAGGTALVGAAASRAATAKWVAREISRSAIIECDTVMCGALIKAGVPSADLLAIRPDRQDPLGADIIVATPVLRSQFGARLSTTYAPAVLGSFGSGGSRIDVRVIAAYGANAYQLALNRDLAARELLGTQIVGNSRIELPAEAQTELAAGQVDPRLLITLPALAQQHAIRVIAFYDRAPGASSGVPLSGVKLAGSYPQAGLTSRSYLRWLVNFLRSQRSVYRAAHIAAAWQQGRAVVFVRFARPNPVGLLH